ncbi:MAG: alpha/beta hydrolase fold domain-containing protein [Polaromonas sp.]|nr:alpha/beta hydrolase fold domain-containing protein [Polaromonas sp.]
MSLTDAPRGHPPGVAAAPVPDAAWLDRMYNNRARVPDHPAHLAHWAEASAAARQSLPCQTDVPYGESAGEKLDIFSASPGATPPAAGAPVLFFIHGGYWRSLDKADHSFIAPPLTAAGACVVVVNYDLCPAVTIPDITMQMFKALAWTWRHIARYGGDPARVTVAGHSAGGHLAAMLLAAHWKDYATDLPERAVKNVLSISGLYDLAPLEHTPSLKDALRLTPSQVRIASPALLPAPSHGVLYSVCGGDESAEFLRQNRLIQDVWGQRTVPVCESLPGLNHFTIMSALADPVQRVHRLALELMDLKPA